MYSQIHRLINILTDNQINMYILTDKQKIIFILTGKHIDRYTYQQINR